MNTYRDLAFMRRAALRSAVPSFILIVGGTVVVQCLGGPGVLAFAAMLAYVAVVGIAVYLVEKRWPLHGR